MAGGAEGSDLQAGDVYAVEVRAVKRAKHIEMTEKQFKAQKRHQFRLLKKALNDLRIGCAYLPVHEHFVNQIGQILDDAEAVLRPWWRKA